MEALFAQLRIAERTARERLIAGCSDDDAKIDRFLDRPIAAAAVAAHEAMAAMGNVADPDLAKNLRREAFERIAEACVEAVISNAALRARARFRIYASEIATVEADIADFISASHLVPAKRILPRMFSVGRIESDEIRVPEPPLGDAEIDEWGRRLRVTARNELKARLKTARERTLRHGYDRLGIIRTRIDLALCVPTRTTQSSHVGFA